MTSVPGAKKVGHRWRRNVVPTGVGVEPATRRAVCAWAHHCPLPAVSPQPGPRGRGTARLAHCHSWYKRSAGAPGIYAAALNQLRVRSASDLRCESGIVGVLRATGPQMEPRPQEGFHHWLGDLSPVFTTRST